MPQPSTGPMWVSAQTIELHLKKHHSRMDDASKAQWAERVHTLKRGFGAMDTGGFTFDTTKALTTVTAVQADLKALEDLEFFRYEPKPDNVRTAFDSICGTLVDTQSWLRLTHSDPEAANVGPVSQTLKASTNPSLSRPGPASLVGSHHLEEVTRWLQEVTNDTKATFESLGS